MFSEPVRYDAGACAAQVLAIAAVILSPLIVGGLIVGLGISELDAGALITAELLVMGATSILVAPLSVRIPCRLLALTGGALLVTGHACSALAGSLDELYPWRILAGLGSGCLAAAVNAAIAQARAPDRLYGLAWASAYTVTTILAIAITGSVETVSHGLVYGALAATLLLFLPLLWFMPGHGGRATALSLPAGSLGPGCTLMIGIMLIGISMMAYYTFLERLAVLAGATAAETGRIIAGAQIAGIVGGLLAAPVARRFGLAPALCAVTALHALAITLAILTDSVLTLGVIAFIEAVLFIIMMPLILTLAAGVDSKGRWAAIAAGVFVLSTALGPVVGALLIEQTGYGGIVWLQWLAGALAVAIFVRVNRGV